MLRQISIPLASAALIASAAVAQPAPTQLSASDQVAAFRAAGFAQKGKQWRRCDDSEASYSPGTVEAVKDLNGDGLPEAVISEGSTFCFGAVGQGYALVSKGSDGTWSLIAEGQGIPAFLTTHGTGNWPDMAVGGPGFCFPVLRWNGSEYAPHRHEYEGKRCTPPQW